jgi:general secretion pathway protein G
MRLHGPTPTIDRPAGAAAARAHGARRGFTLIELVVVLSLIGLLLALAMPRYFHSLDVGRAAVQRQNIATIRDAIDKFYGDLGRYPDSLEDLVAKQYLREVPVDPLTDKPDWELVAPQDTTQGAVYDIRSAIKPQSAAVAVEGG